MATEEIHLNAALEAEGIEALETDLGEYIIQLAGETPSHIIAPAIHKTKGQIAELFVDKLGIERTSDVSKLTSTARQILRAKFGAADIGIVDVRADGYRLRLVDHPAALHSRRRQSSDLLRVGGSGSRRSTVRRPAVDAGPVRSALADSRS